jgi:hypothetical protein
MCTNGISPHCNLWHFPKIFPQTEDQNGTYYRMMMFGNRVLRRISGHLDLNRRKELKAGKTA